jgi:hypothetical protein
MELTARLNKHLQAVIVGDVVLARKLFLSFAALLNAHSLAEDRILMPVFEKLKLQSNGCTLDILDKEHRKLRRLMADAHHRIFAPDTDLTPGVRLLWIEETRMLKEVLEHHDVRERAAFNPALDTALGQAEAGALAGEALQLEKELEAQYLVEYLAAIES